MPTLTSALRVACAERPVDPLRFLATQLLAAAEKVGSCACPRRLQVMWLSRSPTDTTNLLLPSIGTSRCALPGGRSVRISTRKLQAALFHNHALDVQQPQAEGAWQEPYNEPVYELQRSKMRAKQARDAARALAAEQKAAK
jgi:hypothetical protein